MKDDPLEFCLALNSSKTLFAENQWSNTFTSRTKPQYYAIWKKLLVVCILLWSFKLIFCDIYVINLEARKILYHQKRWNSGWEPLSLLRSINSFISVLFFGMRLSCTNPYGSTKFFLIIPAKWLIKFYAHISSAKSFRFCILCKNLVIRYISKCWHLMFKGKRLTCLKSLIF